MLVRCELLQKLLHHPLILQLRALIRVIVATVEDCQLFRCAGKSMQFTRVAHRHDLITAPVHHEQWASNAIDARGVVITNTCQKSARQVGVVLLTHRRHAGEGGLQH